MAGIRGRNTKPELAVRQFLHRAGLRYRLHDRRLPGRPDLVFPKHRVVVEVRGCFWHQHPGCRFAYMPKSNQRFWAAKLAANVARDQMNAAALKALGWRVIVVWECETGIPGVLRRILARIRDGKMRPRPIIRATAR